MTATTRDVQDVPLDYARLRAMLRPRFPEEAELNLDMFMKVEAALTLAQRLGGPDFDVTRVDRLLSNYALLRPETFGADEHLMQMARRNLFRLSSSSAWRKVLKEYQDDQLAPLRFFDFEGTAIRLRERPFGAFDRRPAYIERLLTPAVKREASNVARPGATYRYWFKPEAWANNPGTLGGVGVPGNKPVSGYRREATLPKGICPNDEPALVREHKGPRDEIIVSLDELIEVAHQIGEATGKTYYACVLEQVRDDGLLTGMAGSSATPAGELRISQVVNLVGLVGAGKSVLAHVLMVALARRGLRVVSLMNAISDVMGSVELLRASGVAASPLVSSRNRLTRLDELSGKDGPMLLDDSVARYLETPCLIDGLAFNEEEPCAYDRVPCRRLFNSRGKPFTCPYWDICPSQAMAREALASQVVVTTPHGFATMMVDGGRKPFFELALEDFDLVMFDEADRVQATLDDIFSPQMSFQELIHDAADPTAIAMKRDPAEKMRDLNEEGFYDLRQSSEQVAKALIASVRTEEVESWHIVKGGAFTALALFNDLTGKGAGAGEGQDCAPGEKEGPAKELLPQAVADDLEALFERRDDADEGLKHAVATSCLGIDGEIYDYALDAYLTSRGCTEMSQTLKQRLSFLLKVMRFDFYLEELAATEDFLSFRDDSMQDLYSFMRFRYTRQQPYLPSALVGNMCGMKLDDNNNLTLFRQYAFGRAFMGSLPWLDTDADGNPAGPHALLLSGSSWAPGCLQYHVNKPVDYVLEAARWKPEKLAESQVRDLGLEQNVSGSCARQRSGNLGTVLSQLTNTLRAELDAPGGGKVLVVVNSYREAEYARDKLEGLLSGREKVCALVKSPREDEERFIPRSEVHRFGNHPARILVAPAASIERGHNIVDADGHATFTAVVFAVRPMPVPGDLEERCRRLNGLIEGRVAEYPSGAADFAQAVRRDAWVRWKCLERDERFPMKVWRQAGKGYLARDRTATILVTIVQIFGRLARLNDPQRPAPHVFFADAAFRGKDEGLAFRTLDEMAGYMRQLMEESLQPQVARALYGPFFEAFEKGIHHV